MQNEQINSTTEDRAWWPSRGQARPCIAVFCSRTSLCVCAHMCVHVLDNKNHSGTRSMIWEEVVGFIHVLSATHLVQYIHTFNSWAAVCAQSKDTVVVEHVQQTFTFESIGTLGGNNCIRDKCLKYNESVLYDALKQVRQKQVQYNETSVQCALKHTHKDQQNQAIIPPK